MLSYMLPSTIFRNHCDHNVKWILNSTLMKDKTESLSRLFEIWIYRLLINKCLRLRRAIGILYLLTVYCLLTTYYYYYSDILRFEDHIILVILGTIAYALFIGINTLFLRKVFSRGFIWTFNILTLLMLIAILLSKWLVWVALNGL